MPLPLSVSREEVHCRRIEMRGYRRADGMYDIEIFSDDGTFVTAHPDSFWAAPAADTLARARAAFERCWSLTPQTVKESR